ncbi:peroxiredoxin [Aureococcus anophagefferens]|nr:peroxiredoxin [Aureococcus anophagefferens]
MASQQAQGALGVLGGAVLEKGTRGGWGTRYLTLQVGDEIPDFSADSSVGKFTYHDMVDGVWSVLVTFPGDREAVATTEMGQLSKLRDEFEARNVRVMGVSCNTKYRHREWIAAVEDIEGCKVAFPLISDADAEISAKLGLYPTTTGRNFYEVLRAVDTVQLSLFHQVATPANWNQGEDVFIGPQLSRVAAQSAFPKGMVEQRPWYRTTPQPDIFG